MNKTSIKLAGGLGNYMLQIAAAYAYAKDNDKELLLTVDDSVVVHKHIDTYKDNVLNNINFQKKQSFSHYKKYSEPSFHYNKIPFIEGDVYLSGYFQSEKYFKKYETEIKELFNFPINIVDKVKSYVLKLDNGDVNMNLDETCSIHVRRGDFLKFPDHHPQQGIQYYMKTIKKIGMDKKFLIFSDDIQWCKENFPEMDNFVFIEGLKDYEDLCLMSLCQDNIICNSTFSWWAAWLNKNKNKVVVAPSKWFGSAYSNYNTDDIYCDGWIKI